MEEDKNCTNIFVTQFGINVINISFDIDQHFLHSTILLLNIFLHAH
jgi:hypothetical protein